ncbi:hypothetical protein LTR28_008362, partial [Elasticomyces elasticus]
TSTGSASQSVTPTSTPPPQHHGLSTGAKAGIGVGVGVGVLALLSALLCGYFLKRRRSKNKQMDMYREPEPKRVEEPVSMSKPSPQYPTTKPQNVYTTSRPQAGYPPARGTHVPQSELSQPAQYARNDATSFNPPGGMVGSGEQAANVVQGNMRTGNVW